MMKNQLYLVNNPEMLPLHYMKLYSEGLNNYMCPICRGGNFTSKAMLKKHLLYHKPKYHTMCVMCGIFLLNEKENIVAHLLSHFPEDKFTCCVCDSVFYDEELTLKHIKDVHEINVGNSHHGNNVYNVSELQNDNNTNVGLVNRTNIPCSSNDEVQILELSGPDGKNYVDMNVYQNRSCSIEDGKNNQVDDSKLVLWHHQNFFTLTDNDRHRCPVCKEVFIYKELLNHILQHEIKHSVSCPNCPLTFSENMQFYNHFHSHLKRRQFQCLKCNMTFRTQFTVIDHLINAHLIYYKCPICKLDFTNLSEAKKHFHHSHDSESKSKFLRSQLSVNENLDKNTFDGRENLDSEVFDSEGEKHQFVISDHHKHFSFNDTYTHHCPVCNVKCTFSTLEAHIKDHNLGESLSCLKCSKVFSNRSTLIKHLILYIKYCPFTCLICKKKLKRYDLIQKHLIEKHNINYRCSMCEKESRTLLSANKHAFSHYSEVTKADVWKKKNQRYVHPDGDVHGELSSSNIAEEIYTGDEKSLERGTGMQAKASIVEVVYGDQTMSNIQNRAVVLLPGSDIYSFPIMQKQDNQDAEIVPEIMVLEEVTHRDPTSADYPDMDNAEVVVLEEIAGMEPDSAGNKNILRKAVASLGSNPLSANQNAPLVKPAVIPHKWILEGNNEQYILALQYEKDLIYEWMRMKNVDLL